MNKIQYIESKFSTEEIQDILQLLGCKRDSPLECYNKSVINRLYEEAKKVD